MAYLLDKLRLRIKVLNSDFERFANRELMGSPYVDMYRSVRHKDYRYNFTIKEFYETEIPFKGDSEGVNNFYLGYEHNSERRGKRKYDLVIEYNPNKCDTRYGLLHRILDLFYWRLSYVDVMGVDICRDFDGVDISNIAYAPGKKRTEKDFRTVSGRTMYIGERGSNGATKIYDKAAEQKLTNGEILTRWETHLVPPSETTVVFFLIGEVDSEFLGVDLPTVYVGENGLTAPDTDMRCYLYGLKNGPFKLSDFSYYKRNKIKPYLDAAALFTVGNDDMPEIIRAIETYFKQYVNEFEIEAYKDTKYVISQLIQTCYERNEVTERRIKNKGSNKLKFKLKKGKAAQLNINAMEQVKLY